MDRRGCRTKTGSHRLSGTFYSRIPCRDEFRLLHRETKRDGRKDWKRYYDASVVAGETEFHQLAKAAQETRAYISLGFSERDAVNGTLYNSNVVFEPDGSYKVHRKLKPTGSERVVWGDAGKEFFPVTTTPWGPIGSLICWESYMPLQGN